MNLLNSSDNLFVKLRIIHNLSSWNELLLQFASPESAEEWYPEDTPSAGSRWPIHSPGRNIWASVFVWQTKCSEVSKIISKIGQKKAKCCWCWCTNDWWWCWPTEYFTEWQVCWVGIGRYGQNWITDDRWWEQCFCKYGRSRITTGHQPWWVFIQSLNCSITSNKSTDTSPTWQCLPPKTRWPSEKLQNRCIVNDCPGRWLHWLTSNYEIWESEIRKKLLTTFQQWWSSRLS